MKRQEVALHRAVGAYLSASLPPSAWFSTFPLGGGGRVRGAQLKAAFTKKGTPDLLIIHKGLSLWIELKAPDGRVRKEQAACHAALRAAGCLVYVCRSVEEVQVALMADNIPLRAKVTA